MKSIKPGRGPSAMGAFGSVIVGIFGVIWTIGAANMGAPPFFVLFGVVFILMAIVQAIQQLHASGWSRRRIAKELAIDRGTVARYLPAPPPDPNAAILPAGSPGSNAATFPGLPAPAAETPPGNGGDDLAAGSNAAILPAGSPGGNVPSSRPPRGRPGQCEPLRELILAKLDRQLSAQRIWQDLVAEQGFGGSYDSVKRYVRRLVAKTPLPFRRMECDPGEEAQVDFGSGAAGSSFTRSVPRSAPVGSRTSSAGSCWRSAARTARFVTLSRCTRRTTRD